MYLLRCRSRETFRRSGRFVDVRHRGISGKGIVERDVGPHFTIFSCMGLLGGSGSEPKVPSL